MANLGKQIILLFFFWLLVTDSVLGQNTPIDRQDFSAPAPQDVRVLAAMVQGTAGATTYYYWVVANYPGGSVMPVANTKIANANATLNGSNYVTVVWMPTQGATSYTLLRTTTPSTPSASCTSCVVTTTASTTANDQSNSTTNLSVTIKGKGTGWFGINNTGYTPYLESNIPISTGLVVNVKMYGALGDGSNDDSTAINAALTANSGKIIYLPCGTYKITAAGLSITGDDTILAGAGFCTVINDTRSSGVSVLVEKSGNIGTRNAVVNLAVISSTTPSPTSRTAFSVIDQNTFLMNNVLVYYATTGISQSGTSSFQQKYGKVWINGITTTGKAVVVNGGGDIEFDGFYAGQSLGAEGDMGVHVVATNGFYLSNFSILRYRIGLQLGYTNTVAQFIFLDTGTFDTNIDQGVLIQPDGATAAVRSVHGVNLWLASNGKDGYKADPLNGASVDGVQFTATRSLNNYYHGFNLNGGINFECIACRVFGNSAQYGGGSNTVNTTGTTVTINTVDAASKNGRFNTNLVGKTITIDGGNYTVATVTSDTILTTTTSVGSRTNVAWSSGAYDTYSGLYAAANVSKFRLVGGKYGQQDSFPNSQKWGVRVETGASNNYLIVGVDMTENVTAGLSDGGTGTSKMIRGNLPANAVSYPTSCAGLSTGTEWNDTGTLKLCP